MGRIKYEIRSNVKVKVDREITLGTTKGQAIKREFVERIIDQFFNKIPEEKKETLNQYIDRFIREIKSGERLHNQHGVLAANICC